MLDDTRDTLRETARAAFDAASNYEEAAERLLEAARHDPAVYQALVGPYEMTAARDYVTALGRRARAVVWRRPTEPDARVAALSRGVTATLLDFRLPSGRRLGDAGRDDVADAARFYGEQASDMAHKARWLAAVAAKTPKRKTVADALDDAALARLQEDTR